MAAQEHRHEEGQDSSSMMMCTWTVPLHPLVYFVARNRASVHTKLLAGFLIGALLLLGMAVLSLVVINRMGQQIEELARLQENMDHARRMEYLITAQSHFRAMALLTNQGFYNDSIALAKMEFLERLDEVESTGQLEDPAFSSKSERPTTVLPHPAPGCWSFTKLKGLTRPWTFTLPKSMRCPMK
jgi:hypothetical protein